MDACSVEAITERADVGKGTFYRHFEDKQAVFEALLDMAVSTLLERLRPSRDPLTDLESMVRHLVRGHLAFASSDAELFSLLQSRLMAGTRRPVDVRDAPLLRYLGEMERLLDPFLPSSNASTRRRVACGVAGFANGFLAASRIGMRREECAMSAASLQQAVAAGISAFLVEEDEEAPVPADVAGGKRIPVAAAEPALSQKG